MPGIYEAFHNFHYYTLWDSLPMSVIALEATKYSGNYIWTAREKMVSAKVKSREELLDTHRGT